MTGPAAVSRSCARSRTRERRSPRRSSRCLQCVVFRSGAPDQAVWGYSNPNSFPVTIPIGCDQRVCAGTAESRPAARVPARDRDRRLPDAFAGAATLAWTLGKRRSAPQQLDALYRDARAAKGDRPGQRSRHLQPAGQRSNCGRTAATEPPQGRSRSASARGRSARQPAREPNLADYELDGLVHPKRRSRRCRSRGRRSTARSRTATSSSAPSRTRAPHRPAHPAAAAAAAATAATVAAAMPAPPTRPHGRPQRPEDSHTGDRRTRAHDHVDDHRDEQLDGRGSGHQRRQGLRAVLPPEAGLAHTVARHLHADACNLGRLAPGASATITAVRARPGSEGF